MTPRALLCPLFLVGALSACSSSTSSAGAPSAGAPTGGSASAGSGNIGTGGGNSAGTTAAGGNNTSGSDGNGSGGTGTSGSGGAPGAGSGGVVGSGGAAANGGTGGVPVMMHPGQCIYRPTGASRKAPEFKLPAPANPAGLILRLMNNCPQTLWVHGSGIPAGAVQLAGRQVGQAPVEQVYDWPGLHGRMSIYEGTDNGYLINFIEMNADPNKAFNVNVSNVDWVGIPVEVRGDDPTKCLTGCYTPLANMMNGCPAKLLDATHQICQAPKNWCANQANINDPICQSILAAGQGTIDNNPKCKGIALGTPAQIYGCGGDWAASPLCCAEANRGYKTDTNDTGNDNTQNCNYYKEEPYSDYSAYAQKVCPFVYSFAYDDWNDQSGFQTCSGAKEMDVTFCPGDP